MRFLISYEVDGRPVDLEIGAGTDATVGDLAAALLARSPHRSIQSLFVPTLTVERRTSRTTLPRNRLLADADLSPGTTVSLTRPAQAIGTLASPRLCVMNGEQKNRTYALLPGTNLVGRGDGADVRLSDQLVSRAHARISVTPHVGIEVIDINSANGVMVDGAFISRTRLTPGQLLTIGDTTFTLQIPAGPATGEIQGKLRDLFIRSPRLPLRFAEETHPAPELPKKPPKSHFPFTMLMAPLFMGSMLYAMTQRLASLLFVVLMPMMMIGMWFENRRSAKTQFAESWREFRSDLAHLHEIVSKRQGRERLVRCEENPSATRLMEATEQKASLLWSRRSDKEGFLQLRLGLGSGVSRVAVSVSSTGSADPRAWNELHTSVLSWGQVADVPVVAELSVCGSVGVAGTANDREPVAYGLLLQAVCLHSPVDLAVAAFLGHSSASSWDWLKWLPHTRGHNLPIPSPLLTSSLGQADLLATEIERLIHERQGTGESDSSLPSLLIVIANDCPLDHARLVSITESGPGCGIHVLWLADAVPELPAAARAFVAVDESGRGRAGFVTDPDAVDPVGVERIGRDAATCAARSMAPIIDAGARANRKPDLPSSVSYVNLIGSRNAENSDSVTERWRETGSMKRYAEPTARPTTLRALIGATATEPCVIDLATQGPHALVGGTTGSGKSELLQTWVLALASDYSPDRVNFLFVDYKGGSAFAQCVQTPHSVGLVTDLTPRLVGRALRSLHAELQRRERILNSVGAKDLETMERRADPTAPPRLIIIVDEFAALTQEVPEFVDGVVDVAQRGRSLGLHLILATQRPTGVIKDNLRANTNLRISLRMADQSDATDVLGVDAAAYFDPETPGRAAVRSGPGRLTHFQTAYVGGYTSASSEQKQELRIAEFRLGGNREWPPETEVPKKSSIVQKCTTTHQESVTQTALDTPAAIPHPQAEQQTDLQRLVASIAQASVENCISTPRRPWLPELPRQLDLAEVVAVASAKAVTKSGHDTSTIPFVMSDRPELQKQPMVGFDPDRSGNLVIYGTGGSGKSTALRSLTLAACLMDTEGPTHVYGLDYGSRGLAMLEPLPHVGSIIAAEDDERARRLMRMLHELVVDRAARFAVEGVASLPEYRATVESDAMPRILLLLDGLAAFRKAHEGSPTPNVYESLLALAADGRPVGVHVVVTADRPGTVPSALASVTPTKIVLRVANENDAALLNVPKQMFDDRSPPGRGIMGDAEVQVAVLGGSSSVGDQSRAVSELCVEMETSWTHPRPETIGRLSTEVDLADLPDDTNGCPTLGLADESLSPMGFPLGGPFIVTGPPGSGRTTTISTMVRSSLRMGGIRQTVLLSPADTTLVRQIPWDEAVSGVDNVARLADRLIPEMAGADECEWLFVIEDAAMFVNTAADLPLQSLVKAARSTKQTVLGEGDTQSMQASWPLLLALRGLRRGIVLQPDQSDGDLLLRTSFPRLRRMEFPLGRGLLVADGQTHRVQVAR